MIGLPDGVTACLFDLDGVLTSTATLHQIAWKQTFDEFLAHRSDGDRSPFTPHDYAAYVDGRPRADGVRTFLASRGIRLPEGDANDSPDAETTNGVGNRKNDALLRLIEEKGVQPYPGSVAYLEAARAAGLSIGVVTSSANGEHVLEVAGLTPFVQVRVDGLTIVEQRLRGKPAPDSFLAGARALGVAPGEAAVFEDALSGVEAGRAGGFGYVVGVDRADQADQLLERGADVVVDDLADLLNGAK
ncbi:HAD family hydrolase [Actinokineospora globicatena]|uniref:HAD family hydrolase n=1 Tax=Actinokineospora globicatena TaxID=103729 RepID=UPI0020A2B733|nr:beta-phosphoglucomutase family hydrolase [Actinokineospora globicatena]MCP2306858.1 haloacid dehalogenase superfamily, subfamily IA, variant 3 with third motif having DD or ED/beta-phosphoglucomutase family hydrolase [Actinokineospora globicatena]GLW82299.1 hydrolase [Actinokineospora globicatena]GLW89108.1 hydrolase [Actinokineospora globicatena]